MKILKAKSSIHKTSVSDLENVVLVAFYENNKTGTAWLRGVA
jgi:hypothetical protein